VLGARPELMRHTSGILWLHYPSHGFPATIISHRVSICFGFKLIDGDGNDLSDTVEDGLLILAKSVVILSPHFILLLPAIDARMASGLRRIKGEDNCFISLREEALVMRKNLLAGFCGLVLLAATAGQAVAQENRTSDKKNKNAAEKTADTTKKVGSEAADKAEDVGDQTKKDTKKVAEGAKSTGSEVKNKTKSVGAEAKDKAEDVKDQTATGAKAGAEKTKAVGSNAADVTKEVGDKTTKGAKKTGNWFSRTFKKIF